MAESKIVGGNNSWLTSLLLLMMLVAKIIEQELETRIWIASEDSDRISWPCFITILSHSIK